MREVVHDTETTGIDPASGHRIVEVGAGRAGQPHPFWPALPALSQSRARHAGGRRARARAHPRLPRPSTGASPTRSTRCSNSSATPSWSCTTRPSISASSMLSWSVFAGPDPGGADGGYALHRAAQVSGRTGKPRRALQALRHRSLHAGEARRATGRRAAHRGLSGAHRRPPAWLELQRAAPVRDAAPAPHADRAAPRAEAARAHCDEAAAHAAFVTTLKDPIWND